MGTLFRSQEMQLVQLFVQVEAAHDTVDELGKLGLVQFRDLNADVNIFQRNFVNEVKRMDEMERKLRFFEEQVKNEALLSMTPTVIISQDTLEDLGDKSLNIDELEGRFDELEKELVQMNTNQEMLFRNNNELVELKYVMMKDAAFFAEASAPHADGTITEVVNDHSGQPLLGQGGARESTPIGRGDGGAPEFTAGRTVRLGFITGVVHREKVIPFERILWRATRGNLFLKHADIEEPIRDPHTGEETFKSVFVIFFQGERSQVKIKKICEAFSANLYPCPDSSTERNELLSQVENRIQDLTEVLSSTKQHRRQVLTDIETCLLAWKTKVIKEKSIYHSMNLFDYDYGRKCLIAEGWCPKTSTEAIQVAMRAATERSGAQMPSILRIIETTASPPTYFPTDKFTNAFQEIVNAYGVARYREVNPAVFTIVTFPFLFAVMFGDLGHGIMLTIFAAYLVAKEKQFSTMKLNEMVGMCFSGRYMLLMMGAFSMYTGLIYNDMFAVGLDFFGSVYQVPPNCASNGACSMIVPGMIYPFGIDPGWKGAINELVFYNSFKMKISIIFGVIQMLCGIVLSAFNALFFRNYLDFVTGFIPQIIFLSFTFGYMCILIIHKWLMPLCTPGSVGESCPHPKVMSTMINMFLKPNSAPVGDDLMYSGQYGMQLFLLLVAFACIPWMLLAKPLVLRSRMKAAAAAKELARQRRDSEVHDGEEADHEPHESHDHDEEHSFGDIMVHQVIHTIEFVLGAVSNTASYLRLWALSLAHAQLSTVFWDQVFIFTLDSGNAFMAFIGFGAWLVATLAVLMVLESLSAFLHALRLHWVEFQSKFYVGDGLRFMPFSYVDILTAADA